MTNSTADERARLVRPKPLLILDLDETLVYSTEASLVNREPDFRVAELNVHKRQYVDQFLRRMQAVYELAVWSAGGAVYVESTVKRLFQNLRAPVFVWSAARCTRRVDQNSDQTYFVKDLKKVRKMGFDKTRMLIVDDLPLNSCRNFGSAVTVRSYLGEHDNELEQLAGYLEGLALLPNFRTVEKRFWRSRQ